MSSYNNMKKVAKAQNGRYGDTEIRNVDDIPSHVNLFEAFVIDNYGTLGEQIVKDMGSGTTNPKDGAPEYFLKGFIDWLTPTDHTGWFSSAYTKTTAEDTARTVVSEGQESLLEQSKMYFGKGGLFDKQEDNVIGANIANAFNLNTQIDDMISKSDMATTSAEANSKFNVASLINQNQATFNDLNKQKFDMKMDLQNKLNELLMGYAQATGEGIEQYKIDEFKAELENTFG